MFASIDDATNEDILAAKSEHPGIGGRRLAQILVPDAEEREIVRAASRINRILKKHKLDRTTGVVASSPREQETAPATTDRPKGRRAQLEADIRQSRLALDRMMDMSTFSAYPRTMALVQEMERELLAIVQAETATSDSDIDEDYILQRLRALPRALLERALE